MSNIYEQYENIVTHVDTLIQEELEKNTQVPVCENGCFYCCTFPVAVGILELLYIAKQVNQFSDEKKNILLNNIDTAYQYSYQNDKYIQKAYFTNTLHNFRTICPFIHNGTCMIYEFRPTNCKSYFSTDSKLCQKGDINLNLLQNPKVNTLVKNTSLLTKETIPKKGFLHNAFIYDGTHIHVDPIYIFKDELIKENSIKLSELILNT